MNGVVSAAQPHITAAQLEPPVHSSAEFLQKWLDERALQSNWGAFELVTGFSPAFKIITHDPTGTPRPELSRTRHFSGPNKYMCPTGIGVVIYAPHPDSFNRFDAATEKWIAEGEGKALALVGLGLPVLSIGGIQSWHLKGQSELHPDLAVRIRAGDVVQIAIDGDWQTNPAVRDGAGRLMLAIEDVGARPLLVELPAADEGKKVGVDDLIATWRRAGLDPRAQLAKLSRLSHLNSAGSVILTADVDLLQRPTQQWVVKDLIPAGELTAVVGETSCGKTFLTMDLLLAVARGLDRWFGQRVKRHGLAVHITLEGSGQANRRRAYQQHHKLEGALPYVAIESQINLREDAEKVAKAIKREAIKQKQPVALIAVDTVNRALGGGDENSSADMGLFLSGAELLKAAFPQAAIVLVHHLGKDPSKGARGHSSFSANVGTQLNVDVDERTGIRTVRVVKQRDGRTDLLFNFMLCIVETGKDDELEPITSCVVKLSAAPALDLEVSDRQLYDWIHRWWVTEFASKPVSREKIRRNFGRIKPKTSKINREQFQAAVEGAVNRGWCTVEKGLRNVELLSFQELPPGKY